MAKSLDSIINKYHIFDSRKILDFFPKGRLIDVTITSPPYWNLKDYGIENQIGFGQSYEESLDDLALVFTGVYKLTKNSGSLWIISDTIKHKGEVLLFPFDLARKLRDIGWVLQDIIIWNKDKTLPWSHKGKLRNIFEYITLFSKSPSFKYNLAKIREINELKSWWVRYPERYSPEGKAPSRTWHFPIPTQGSWSDNWIRHFNPLPPQLIGRILNLTTNEGDLVLDTFAGSGVILAQAHAMGRKYIGFDLNKEYQTMFTKRVFKRVQEDYTITKQIVEVEQKRKSDFGKLIRYLRKTKYPKELFRIYTRDNGKLAVDAILAISSGKRDFLEVIFLISDEHIDNKLFLLKAIEVSNKPPLSKYGITVEIGVCAKESINTTWLNSKGIKEDRIYYIYKNGRTYSWSRKIKFKEWVNELNQISKTDINKQKYPPIISNIAVSVSPNSPPF